MLIVTLALALASLAVQAPATPLPPAATLKAALGGICSADFTVKDTAGAPVYAAMIHVKVRYGTFGVKRADLEIGTGSDGKARIEGLPEKARPLMFDIKKNGLEGFAAQNVEEKCHATFEVTIK